MDDFKDALTPEVVRGAHERLVEYLRDIYTVGSILWKTLLLHRDDDCLADDWFSEDFRPVIRAIAGYQLNMQAITAELDICRQAFRESAMGSQRDEVLLFADSTGSAHETASKIIANVGVAVRRMLPNEPDGSWYTVDELYGISLVAMQRNFCEDRGGCATLLNQIATGKVDFEKMIRAMRLERNGALEIIGQRKVSSRATNDDRSVDDKALAILLAHPNWTNKQIAEEGGFNVKTLTKKRTPGFFVARAAQKAGKEDRRKGTKYNGSIEIVHEDENDFEE